MLYMEVVFFLNHSNSVLRHRLSYFNDKSK
jgi:hypothetical protein